MWDQIVALVHNPFIMAVGGLQLVGGVYSFTTGDLESSIALSVLPTVFCQQ